MSKHPFQTDTAHLYNQLTNLGINKVDLGWRVFKLMLSEDLKDESGEVSLDGSTNFTNYEIHLDMSLNDDRAREILLHEIIHCILETMSIDENGRKHLKTTNEQLVVAMTHGFLLIRNLNRSLFSLLY